MDRIRNSAGEWQVPYIFKNKSTKNHEIFLELEQKSNRIMGSSLAREEKKNFVTHCVFKTKMFIA